MHFNIMVL